MSRKREHRALRRRTAFLFSRYTGRSFNDSLTDADNFYTILQTVPVGQRPVWHHPLTKILADLYDVHWEAAGFAAEAVVKGPVVSLSLAEPFKPGVLKPGVATSVASGKYHADPVNFVVPDTKVPIPVTGWVWSVAWPPGYTPPAGAALPVIIAGAGTTDATIASTGKETVEAIVSVTAKTAGKDFSATLQQRFLHIDPALTHHAIVLTYTGISLTA